MMYLLMSVSLTGLCVYAGTFIPYQMSYAWAWALYGVTPSPPRRDTREWGVEDSQGFVFHKQRPYPPTYSKLTTRSHIVQWSGGRVLTVPGGVSFSFDRPLGLQTRPGIRALCGRLLDREGHAPLFPGMVTGTVATGCWVIGHECGHNAFSDNTFLQDTVGGGPPPDHRLGRRGGGGIIVRRKCYCSEHHNGSELSPSFMHLSLEAVLLSNTPMQWGPGGVPHPLHPPRALLLVAALPRRPPRQHEPYGSRRNPPRPRSTPHPWIPPASSFPEPEPMPPLGSIILQPRGKHLVPVTVGQWYHPLQQVMGKHLATPPQPAPLLVGGRHNSYSCF